MWPDSICVSAPWRLIRTVCSSWRWVLNRTDPKEPEPIPTVNQSTHQLNWLVENQIKSNFNCIAHFSSKAPNRLRSEPMPVDRTGRVSAETEPDPFCVGSDRVGGQAPGRFYRTGLGLAGLSGETDGLSVSSGRVRSMLVLIRYGSSPGRFCIQTGLALFRTTQRQTHWQSASRKHLLNPFKITASDTHNLWHQGTDESWEVLVLVHWGQSDSVSHHTSGKEEVADGDGEQAAPAGGWTESSAAPKGWFYW